MFEKLLLLLVLTIHGVQTTFYGHDYYNDRYSAQGIAYTDIDRQNGLWSDQPDLLKDNYLLENVEYLSETCTGCTCSGDTVASCDGPVVELIGQTFTTIAAGTFSENVTSIKILSCPNFETFADKIFASLVNLESILVQDTILNHVPDLSTTAVQIVNLASNKIKIDSKVRWNLPSTITHLALMHNEIYYIPRQWIAGPNLRIVSLSYNRFTQIQSNIFGSLPSLVYLGLDGNLIRKLTSGSLSALQSSTVVHINCSNNILDSLKPNTFSSITSLKILELHNNSLTTIEQNSLTNLPNLIHLDLHANNLARLTTRSFRDLPSLIELRLHSQKTPMTSIVYDAWSNIGTELVYLFVSDNELPSFPHQVLEQENYPKLEMIFADHNLITNATGYGEEAYSSYNMYKKALANFHYAFTKYPVLNTLTLDHNLITDIESSTFCNATSLQTLNMSSNTLTETSIASEAFSCFVNLTALDLSENLIQYVPTALSGSEAPVTLETLILNNNKLTFLEEGVFTNLSSLKQLELSDNGIIAIEDGTFPVSLQSLNLANNSFVFLHQHPFSNLHDLLTLDLNYNNIDYVPPDAFQNCTSLTEIQMSYNQIPQLLLSHFASSPLNGSITFSNNQIGWIEDGALSHVTTLAGLDLSNNELTKLPSGGDFSNLMIPNRTDVEDTLDFSGNRINVLPSNTFANLDINNTLQLSNNKITRIESEAFNGVTASNIDLRNNSLRQLQTSAFKDVTLLGNLDLSESQLTELPTPTLYTLTAQNVFLGSSGIRTIHPEALYDVTVSEDIDLSGNAISVIEGSIFGGSSTVGQRLLLQNNGLTGMSFDALNNVVLNEIYLSDNLLTIFPLALTTQNPEIIDLDSNRLAQIPDGSLTNMTNLRQLLLSNNQLKTIQARLFDDLTGLQQLYLDNNTIEYIADGVFDNLTMLERFSAPNNHITHFPAFGNSSLLTYVDLSNNDIETFGNTASSDTPALTELHLANNPLGCTCQFISQLHSIKEVVQSGACGFPVATSGITLGIDTVSNSTYYTNSNYSLFQCTGENITAVTMDESVIEVSWDHPSQLYIDIENNADSPALAGNITYTVTCVSTSAATLEDTVTVYMYNASEGPSSLSLNLTSGVVVGATYDCSVKLRKDNYTSAKSAPAIVTVTAEETAVNGTTADTNGTTAANGTDTGAQNDTSTGTGSSTGSSGTAGPLDIELDIVYYDFSKTHPDFDSVSYITMSSPSYVASPYGAWLTVTGNPSAETLSQWYRFNDKINFQVTSTLILTHQNGTLKRFSSSQFFPLDDGYGYGGQEQLDINGTEHNFGFTSVIRTGLVFNGTESITVGGGEGVWLYINKVLVIEIVSTDSVNHTCHRIDLSPAANQGGGTIIPEEGIISGGVCTGLSPLSNGLHLELQIGETYHFDLFHAETKLDTSELLFEVEGTTFMTDPLTQLPLDYWVTVGEDFYVNDTVETLILTDHFSVGPYDIELYKGNEMRQFDIKETSDFVTPSTTPPTYRTVTDIDGNILQYVECDSANSSTNEPATLDNTTESFSVTSTSVLLTLKADLDYDTTQEYYLLMTIVDTGHTPQLTGSIAVRITITDANDNCPEISPTSVTLNPVPVLTTNASVTFTSVDADSGENANIRYVLTEITEVPVVSFNTSLDLHKDIYENSTSLVFEVIAMDNGTVPRGSSATVNITISNSCLLDARYTNTEYKVTVNDTTGELFLRIPKYYVYPYDCMDLVGLSTYVVLDTQMAASSSYHDVITGPGRARVNLTYNEYSELAGAWVAGTVDTNQSVELHMESDYKFQQIHIQGREDAAEWVTSFRILYVDSNSTSNDTNWLEYVDKTGQNIFLGNTDQNTVRVIDLDPFIISRRIKVNPLTWHSGNISMRLEFTGCSTATQLYYDVSCFRCETTYYCEGDGDMKTCGRCENSSSTCDRDPTEYSFGHASECSPCPDGWLCSEGNATTCEDNYYVDYCNSTFCPATCSPCEPGYACLDGRRTACSPGTYSDGTFKHCEACSPGTYQNKSGQGACISCESGYWSATAMSACSPCAYNELSSPNKSSCQACADSTECPCMAGGSANCFSLDDCLNTGSGSFSCGSCPVGFEGDGVTCTDIDECALYNPCYGNCTNTSPGYQCHECPDGMAGTYEDAYAYDYHQRNFEFGNTELSNFTHQYCYDINECATDNGGCGSYVTCVNTPGSFYCDQCGEGYLGNITTGCYLADYCTSGAHDCSDISSCVYIGPAQYRCECLPGYGGKRCTLDSDNDGWPDSAQSCSDAGCARDNCPSIANSNQEDTDGDTLGDSCDDDDDNDGILDDVDNCQFIANTGQTDTDSDGVGDSCDNCPNNTNSDQLDSDGDGEGDVCDTDDDDDGIFDGDDNCPTVANADQTDTDTDGVGDACDNCVNDSNADQLDTDQNGFGDVCDPPGGTDKDEDGDGILDILDNCPSYPNADQSDIDGNGQGDMCDTDIDGDGILNSVDNCPYLSNTAQTDSDSDGLGDDCVTDSDGDGSPDYADTCPFNPGINATSFTAYFTVALYPTLNTTAPSWVVKSGGTEVVQKASTGMPTMLIGDQNYGAIEYKGTWFVTDTSATDYIGFVFGYQSNRKFYLVTWKRTHSNYDVTSNYRSGIKGLQIKLVNSISGPDEALAEALWHSHDTTDHVTMLWHDTRLQGWEPNKSYRWILTHQPSTGYIRLLIYQGSSQVLDSGAVYDSTITGGRVGVYQFGAFPVTWTYLEVNCLEHLNKGLYLDGVDDFIELEDIPTLEMEESFTFEIWVALDTGYAAGPYPIFCSEESTVCIWIEDSLVKGSYGDSGVTVGSTTLTEGQWHNVIFRYSMEDQTVTIFVDGVQDGITSGVAHLDFVALNATERLHMYIGKVPNFRVLPSHINTTAYFRGTIDEVRLYRLAIPDDEIVEHIGYETLELPVWKSYGNLHFKMEESAGATTLTNSGRLTAVPTLSGGTFVTSYQQNEQFKIANPNNRK